MIIILTIVCTGIAVAALAAGVAIALRGNSDSAAEDRLQSLAARRLPSRGESEDAVHLTDQFNDAKSFFDQLVGDLPGLGTYIDQADAQMSPGKFLAICGGCFGGGLILTIATPVPSLLAPVTGVLFAAIPVGWLMLRRKKRLAKFGTQLPEALELLGRSLRAGHSLAAGFGLIASELQDPVRREFARAFEEQNLGVPLEEALEDMTVRMPNIDLRFFATAVILQRQTGGDLAEILDKIGNLIRQRIQIMGQVQALTGEGRLSGIVLLGLPPVLLVVMLYLNYDYSMMLFTDPLGRKMFAGALLMQFFGALVIRKIVTIKV